MSTAIEFNHVSKQYRLGLVSTKTLSHDIRRFWITNVLGKEDPYLKIGETNDRASKGNSEYVWALRDIDFKVEQGDISVVENGETVPFDIKRLYYLYDVPGGVSRGGHAHKGLWQLIIAASGCFTVTLDDGNVKRAFTLNRPYQGLLVKPGIWRELDDFSSGSVCLVLASEKYDASDYIRDYAEFLKYKGVKE